MFGGMVLAAGASTRLGRPKALVPVDGQPAVAHVARVLRGAGCADVVVVTGADHDRVAAAVPARARVIHHPDWARGQTSSVQAGLRALPAAANVLVWPVDHPAVASSTVAALLAGPGAIRVPTHGGRRGHPSLFAAPLRAEILALDENQPLHDVVHAKPDRVVEVPVADPAILLNVDTPADLKRLEQHLRRVGRARPVA
jgi:molybdenum cofactor cytidylyltransferase